MKFRSYSIEAIYRNRWYVLAKDLLKAGELIDQNTAVLSRKYFLEGYSRQSQKDILISQDFVTVMPTGFVVNRKFCCKRKLNQIMSRLVSAGIIEKITEQADFKHKLKFSKNYTHNSDTVYALSVEDLFGILFLLTIGLSIAMLTLIVEIFGSQAQSVEIIRWIRNSS